jgi:ABC-type transport system involved in cytochrome c biogenesis permease subunit
MNQTFIFLTVLAYLFSLGLYVRFLYTGQERTGQFATLLLLLGLAAHYVALLLRARGTHTVPYHDLQGSMSLFGWLLAVTYLCLEIYHRQRTVGAFVVPIILAFFFAAYLVPDHPGAPAPARGVVFALHVTLSILSYSAFALSCVLSLIYLVEERFLRIRKLGDVVWRLPSLDLLERMSRTSVLVGLITIAFGTLLGFVAVDRQAGQHWFYDPKYVVTLVVLLLYAIYFGLARTTAWRGARASKLCVFNFVLVVLSFTVVNLFLSQHHRFL